MLLSRSRLCQPSHRYGSVHESPMRLLIVEDSDLIRKVTRLAFPSRQHELHEAENGRKALDILTSVGEPFDAIVLDLQMPDMNGVEFLRELRHRPRHAATPIVIATSEADDSPLLQEARGLGVAAVLKKPWKPHELAATVQQAAASRRS
jgi:two-component system chemotaxis response regulator CheY